MQYLTKDILFQIRNNYYNSWTKIVADFILTEDFIREFQNKVNWWDISRFQYMSEDFISNYRNYIDWNNICTYQKLSESFIRKFYDKVNWNYICKYQKLSEDFIREFQDKVDWYKIVIYQKLNKEFIYEFKDKFDLINYDYITLYWSKEDKIKYLKQFPQYKIIDNSYIIAHKGIRYDRYSKFNFQYQYLPGNTYECHADHNLDEQNSFGLSAWTEEKAKYYCDELVIEVKIYIEDIAAIVHKGGKIRCSKFEVLN